MRARTPSEGGAGFTLLELVVSMAVGALVLLGATALLQGQLRAFSSTSAERALLEAGRIALDSLATDLRLAGLGVDPALVFDFGPLPAASMAMGPAGNAFATTALECPTAVSCRDRIDGPDEVVFLARDPAFGKPLAAAATAASTSLTVRGPLNAPLHRGQILQVLCYSGDMTWAYVSVGATVPASAASTVEIPLQAGTGKFPFLNASLAAACFSSVAGLDAASLQTAAKVFKVDRFRYFIRSFDAEGGTVAWGAAGSRPWLMLDRGTYDTVSGAAVVEPVAPDVEDLQLAYGFPLDLASPLVGAASGVALEDGAAGVDLSAASPVYGDDVAAAARLTHHPANLRTVRLSVVVRSPEATLPDDGTIPAALNRPALTGQAGFRRLRLQTSVPIRNLDARAPYYPVHGTGADQLNVGGG